MVVSLMNGKVFIPQGEPEVVPMGLMIEESSRRTLIPLSQIKWIHWGQDFQEDQTILKAAKSKSKKPIGRLSQMNSVELIRGLY